MKTFIVEVMLFLIALVTIGLLLLGLAEVCFGPMLRGGL